MMVAMTTPLEFTSETRDTLNYERYHHPVPLVQRRMEVLWGICQGLAYPEAGRLGGVSDATVDRYVAIYRQGGREALRDLNWGKSSVSELVQHKESLEKIFLEQPPHTIAEACHRIKEATGIQRAPRKCASF